MNSFAGGRDVLMAFSADISEVIKNSLTTNHNEKGYIMMEAAKILSRKSLPLPLC